MQFQKQLMEQDWVAAMDEHICLLPKEKIRS